MVTKISGDTGVSQCQPNSVSQDDLQGGVVGKGPAFQAKGINEIYPVNVWDKLKFATEDRDTNNNYNIANSRFTPTVAGFYALSCTAYINESGAGVSQYSINLAISMNNLFSPAWSSGYGNDSAPMGVSCSALVYMNGTTDFVDVDIQPLGPSGSLNIFASIFSGALVRAA